MSWQCEGVPPCRGCSDCLLVPIGSVLVPLVPIGAERIPCECGQRPSWGPWYLSRPCDECYGLGCHYEPLFPADFDVGLDTLRRELDPTFPDLDVAQCWMCDGIGLWPPVEREAESVLDACPVCHGRQAVALGDPWTAKTKAPVTRGGNPGRGLTSAADCETLCRSPGDRLDSP